MDTRTRIARKCDTERGASILMALFLMLVCVTISSVILAAATASAGRIAKLAESDRRYYAVSSAAELIVEMVKDDRVVITEERTPGEGGSAASYDAPVVKKATEEGDAETADPDKLTTLLTNLLMYGQKETPAMSDTFWDAHKNGTWAVSDSSVEQIDFTPASGDSDVASAADVTVSARRKAGGIVEVTISSDHTGDQVYTTKLVLAPYVEIEVDEDDSPEITSIYVKWDASKIQVVR